MILKLRHKQTGEEIVIETPHDDPDRSFQFSYSGDYSQALKTELLESYGHYGHGIELEAITNLDLQAAAYKLPSFEVVNVQPQINPSALPQGAVS